MKVFKYISLLYLLFPFVIHAQENMQTYFVYTIERYDSLGNGKYKAYLSQGQDWGIIPDQEGKLYGHYQEENPSRNEMIGEVQIKGLSSSSATLSVQLLEGKQLEKGDFVYLLSSAPVLPAYSDLYALLQYRMQLEDTLGNPLYSFEELRDTDTSAKEEAVFRKMIEEVQQYISHRKERLDTVKIDIEGFFGQKSIGQASRELQTSDARSLVRYLKAVPLQYSGRSLPAHRLMLLWMLSGGYCTADDLRDIYLGASADRWPELDSRYADQVLPEKIKAWVEAYEKSPEERLLKLCNYHYRRIDQTKGLIAAHKLLFFKLQLAVASEDKKGGIYELLQAYIRDNLQEIDDLQEVQEACWGLLAGYGDWLFAKEAYKEYREQQRQLVNLGRRWEKSRSKIGGALWNIGNGYQAEKEYGAARPYLLEALTYYDPDTGNGLYALGYYQREIGGNYELDQMPDSAAWHYERSLGLLKKLYDGFPENVTAVQELSKTHYYFADLLVKQQAEASSIEQQYRASLELAEKYVGLDNNSYDSRVFYNSLLSGLAGYYKQQQQYAQELPLHQKRYTLFTADEAAYLADIQWDLGIAYANTQQKMKAIAAYEQALPYYQSIGRQQSQHTLLKNIAQNYKGLGNMESYEEKLLQAVAVLQELDTEEKKVELGNAHESLGDYYTGLSQYEKAMEHYLIRLELTKQTSNYKEIGDAYWDIGVWHANQSHSREAIQNYHQALGEYREVKDGFFSRSLLLGNIAGSYANLHYYDSAVAYDIKAVENLEKAVDLESSWQNSMELGEYQARLAKRHASQLNQEKMEYWIQQANAHYPIMLRSFPESEEDIHRAQGEILDFIADSYEEMSLFAKAGEAQKERIVVLEQSSDSVNLADAYFGVGYSLHGTLQNQESLEYYAKAIQLYEQLEDTSSVALTLSNRALALWSEGKVAEAIGSHQKAIHYAGAIKDYNRMGYSWKELGVVYYRTGEIEKAKEAFSKAVFYYQSIQDPGLLLKAYKGIAAAFANNQNYAEARGYYLKAKELAFQEGNHFEEAELLNLTGDMYANQLQYQQSAHYYQQAMELADQSQNPKQEAQAYLNMGNLLNRQSRGEEALPYFDKGMQLAEKGNLNFMKVYGMIGQGQAYSEAGELSKSQAIWHRALDEAMRVNDLGAKAVVCRSLGSLKLSLGEPDSCFSYYQEALRLSKESKQRGQVASTNLYLADVYIFNGFYNRADSLIHETHRIYQEEKNPWGIAGARLTMGNLSHALGKYKEAIGHYKFCDSLQQKLDDPYSRSTALNNIGSIYYWQGDYQKCLDYMDQALELLDSVGVRNPSYIMSFLNRGEALMELGQLEEAKEIAKEALELASAQGDASGQVSATRVLGAIAFKGKNYEEAIRYFSHAYELNESTNNALGKLALSTALGKSYFEKGDRTKAISYLQESVEAHEETGSEKYLWEALYYQGLAAADSSSSIALLSRSVEILERIQNRLAGGEEAKKLFNAGAEKIKVYDALIKVLLQNGRTAEAMQYLDRSNNQELRNRIRREADLDKNQKFGETLKKERSLQAEIDQIDSQIALEKRRVNTSQERLLQLQQTRSIAEKEYQRFATEIHNQQPELYTYLSIKPIDFKRSKRMIPKGVAMVSYLLGEKQLYIFVATADTLVAKEIQVSREEIFKHVQFLTKYTANAIGGEEFGPKEDLLGKGSELEFNQRESDFKKYAEQLNTWLILPIEEELKGKQRVGIVPSGILHFLPFQMLGYTSANGRFVSALEQYPIFYASSLMVLHQLGRDAAELKVLAFGNADGTLPATETELKQIQEVFPNTSAFVGKEAKERVLKERHEQYNALHFATHGNLDPYDPFLSHLILSGDDQGEDGDLTVDEISEFGLYDYELVTLSACETALPTSSEQWPVSPATGFLGAGASTVIGSLWKVDDKATGQLMSFFYQYLKEGKEKVDALRLAQIRLSQQEGFAHPYYWAPFVLIGSWR